MDIKDEILKIYNDPSSYNATVLHNKVYGQACFDMLNFCLSILNNDSKAAADTIKKFMLCNEWNDFEDDLSDEELIEEHRRWREFCSWCDRFDWCKGLDKDKCIRI